MLHRLWWLLTRGRPHVHFDTYPITEAMANLKAAIADSSDGHEIKPPKPPRSS
jgi:hypothetical protein